MNYLILFLVGIASVLSSPINQIGKESAPYTVTTKELTSPDDLIVFEKEEKPIDLVSILLKSIEIPHTRDLSDEQIDPRIWPAVVAALTHPTTLAVAGTASGALTTKLLNKIWRRDDEMARFAQLVPLYTAISTGALTAAVTHAIDKLGK
ncbi:hypothetical protein SNEBB_009195 [Seison nebaliae]|nr:hypothetical protein SNEBB_009195 [Seison nebaliae]